MKPCLCWQMWWTTFSNGMVWSALHFYQAVVSSQWPHWLGRRSWGVSNGPCWGLNTDMRTFCRKQMNFGSQRNARRRCLEKLGDSPFHMRLLTTNHQLLIFGKKDLHYFWKLKVCMPWSTGQSDLSGSAELRIQFNVFLIQNFGPLPKGKTTQHGNLVPLRKSYPICQRSIFFSIQTQKSDQFFGILLQNPLQQPASLGQPDFQPLIGRMPCPRCRDLAQSDKMPCMQRPPAKVRYPIVKM